jgi:MFS family permease
MLECKRKGPYSGAFCYHRFMSPTRRKPATTLPYPIVAAMYLIGTVVGGVIAGLVLGLPWWWWVVLAIMVAGTQITTFIVFRRNANARRERSQ